jgi:hypothetical protein
MNIGIHLMLRTGCSANKDMSSLRRRLYGHWKRFDWQRIRLRRQCYAMMMRRIRLTFSGRIRGSNKTYSIDEAQKRRQGMPPKGLITVRKSRTRTIRDPRIRTAVLGCTGPKGLRRRASRNLMYRGDTHTSAMIRTSYDAFTKMTNSNPPVPCFKA